MWSQADRLHVKVTPRSFSEFSQVMSGSRCGGVKFFLLLLSYKMISLLLDLFGARLFFFAHALVQQCGIASWKQE